VLLNDNCCQSVAVMMLAIMFGTWLSVGLCTLVRLAAAGELTFELPDNEKMCFYEFVQKGVECVLEYQVHVSRTTYDTHW